MNLIAKIKRLELEAAERDKRIAALEGKVMDQPLPDEELDRYGVPASLPQLLAEFRPLDLPPKKRKPRAKTSGTE